MLLAGPTSTECAGWRLYKQVAKWLHTQVISVEDSKHSID